MPKKTAAKTTSTRSISYDATMQALAWILSVQNAIIGALERAGVATEEEILSEAAHVMDHGQSGCGCGSHDHGDGCASGEGKKGAGCGCAEPAKKKKASPARRKK